MKFPGACLLLFILFMILHITSIAGAKSVELKSFRAAADQVLVIYNADWKIKSDRTTAKQESREIAEYYVKMHTDPASGKKPFLLGLSCMHWGKNHLNEWVIKEESTDNRNGIVFKGKGSAPSTLDWLRDSRKVEISLSEPEADWNSLTIICKSEATGEKRIVTPLTTALSITGIPAQMSDAATYPPVQEGKGRSIRLDASKLFAGTVTIALNLKNRSGKEIKNISLRYWDARDFAFSATGADGIPDDKILEEDILQPARAFLEDPKNALPDGTLLKDQILYIVVVHGMPFAGMGVYGIEHGATFNRGDHGSLASIEQRLQTMYYEWKFMKPPIITHYMSGGPDAEKGVKNHIITTAIRLPLTDVKWNPYMHPDNYSYLRKSKKVPTFHLVPPFSERRKALKPRFFAYAVSRIDGAKTEESKRIIDYSIYASRYLRPEMDCRVRAGRSGANPGNTLDLGERLSRVERENIWGEKELEALGFIVLNSTENQQSQGLPFMARPAKDSTDSCGKEEKAVWSASGFYPGGMERRVISHNGLNNKNAEIWDQIAKGVTVSAAGSPAYGGGPHITNATFWDNRILARYLFRGRDLGECFLLSTYYINWSTSLIGDPLFHPDLRETVADTTPPRAAAPPELHFTADPSAATAHIRVELAETPNTPEVALLQATVRNNVGNEITVVSPLYSRRPSVSVPDLKPGIEYTFQVALIDPYGNRTTLPPVQGKSSLADTGATLLQRAMNVIQGK